ncbi:MAG: hypothetical protein H6600_09275 [Flavobacteriales bacterium]|nr:hypothetical protein [Flavobacteriales bacterium]
MKNFTIILAGLLSYLSSFGQAPEGMTYQAIVRDQNSAIVASQNVGIQISILQYSSTGSSVYSEVHSTNTNTNGLLTLMIGEGTPSIGNIDSIDWSDGPYFLKTETDPNGGSNYTITGVNQLMSVPYALHANTAERLLETSTGYIFDDTIGSFNVKINNGTHSFFDVTSTTEIYNSVTAQMAIVGVSADNHNPIDPNDTRALMVHNDAIRHLTKTVVCEPAELTISVQNDSIGALGQNPFQAVFQMRDNSKDIFLGNAYENPDQQNAFMLGTDYSFMYFTDDDGVTSRGFFFKNDGFGLVKDDTNLLFNVDMDGVTTINDVMKITPRSAAPSNPDKGTVYFDDTTNKLMVYDGTTWQACW